MKYKIKFLRSSVVLLLAFVGVLIIAIPKPAKALGPVPENLLASLRDVNTAVEEVEKALKNIKVDDLTLSYREGKAIEKSRSQALSGSSMIRKEIALFQGRSSLTTLFLISHSLLQLEWEVERLISMLSQSLSQPEREANVKVHKWWNALIEITDPLYKTNLSLNDEAVKFFEKADEAQERYSK